MQFEGKTVLITGGSRGIGRATALAFAAEGAKVAINFRNDSQAAAETIEAMEGEDHFAVKADISHPDAVNRMLEAVVAEFGRLDILVNNAGIFVEHQIDQVNYADWQSQWAKTLDVNLTGPANTCFCAAQHMMTQKSGAIINISSRGAFRGEPNHPAYGASKAGLNSMSQSLAQKLAPYGVFVGVVAPGFVATDMAQPILDSEAGPGIRAQSPLNRVATPDEIAQCVLFLASGKANYATGCIFDVNGASYLRN
jgi:3-oxoacyl-[acyl-carrier protein] reductase